MDQSEYEHYQMQDAMQQNQMEAQRNMMLPQMMEQVQQTQAVLVEQTNPNKLVESIMLRLRGLRRKEDGSLIRVSEPKLNKAGQENIWFILDSHVNQGGILSHLDKQEIQNLMHALSDDLVDDLTLNWREYGIKTKTDLDVINNSILCNIFLVLKRSEQQNEKNWLGKISIENITNQPRLPNLKKEGFLSKLRL